MLACGKASITVFYSLTEFEETKEGRVGEASMNRVDQPLSFRDPER